MACLVGEAWSIRLSWVPVGLRSLGMELRSPGVRVGAFFEQPLSAEVVSVPDWHVVSVFVAAVPSHVEATCTKGMKKHLLL